MKKFIRLIILLTISQHAFAQPEDQADLAFFKAANQWFNAWKLLSKDIFHVPAVKPVDFIFFDSQYVYSTSAAYATGGNNVKGPSLMNNKYEWKRSLHNGKLVLPDSSKIPVGLLSFAGENKAAGNKAFFVMPLPSFWKTAAVSSKELGLENLVTGVFLHEFSHSQQMENFGKRISFFEQSSDYGFDFSDDIVQDIFGNDSVYISLFRHEVAELYEASFSKNKYEKNRLAEKAFESIRKRQAAYFNGKYSTLNQIDNFFLTMEGLGQYAMYAWLKHPKGANLPAEQVIAGVRRGKKQWSQEEGFALFLLLEKYSPASKWAPAMFGTKTESVTDLILNKIN